jgi:5-formyltetrahydrofolate cyclo-ligase
MPSFNTKKDKIRYKFKKLRLKLSENEVSIKSAMITLKLQNLDCVRSAKSVLLYVPVKNEVDTRYIFNSLVESQKKIFLPAYGKSGWCISKYKIDDDLISGPFNIKQPKKLSRVDIGDCDVAIIPGIVFSEGGTRVGYGKGVYDKLLVNSNCVKIGLCYDFQIVKSLKPDLNDIPMDIIISEKRIARR